jgi:hypothetical protein
LWHGHPARVEGVKQLFALDTSGFSMNGAVAPGQNSFFTLEFEPIAGDSGHYDLMLGFNATPEPSAMLPTVLGFAGVVLPRRRTLKRKG